MQTHRSARALQPGSAGFIVALSMSMASIALAIDTLLPAFPEIRAHLGLEPESTAVAGLVSAFLIGSGLGLLPAGLLADRYGRRPVLWGGLAVYVVGAVGAVLAPSLGLMLAARFVWGLGSAGPRVAVTAMIRDSFEGEQMARQMSLMMAVFLVVPTVAPAIGAGLIAVGPWQLVYWLCVAFGLGVFAFSLRLPATMPADQRRSLSTREVWQSIRIVFTTPGTTGYLLAMVGLFAAFISYLASSEIIIDEVFGLSDWFPLIFGGMAVMMSIAMVTNGRVVERVGLDRIIGLMLTALVVADIGLVSVALLTDGRPPFWLFMAVLAVVIGCQQVLTPNLNAAAMRPLGPVAGTGAAVLGMVPMVVGSVLGSIIDRAFDGTITPISFGFLASAAATVFGVTWARRAVVADVSGPVTATAAS